MSHTLNLTRHHSIHGAGPGKDIIFQLDEQGKPHIYDRTGTELPPDSKELLRRGLVMTEALRVQMNAAITSERELELEKRLQMAMKKAEEIERDRVARGLPPSWESSDMEDPIEDVEDEFTTSLLEDID